MAEREGVEPSEQVTPLNGLANRRTRPLCDLSADGNSTPTASPVRARRPRSRDLAAFSTDCLKSRPRAGTTRDACRLAACPGASDEATAARAHTPRERLGRGREVGMALGASEPVM